MADAPAPEPSSTPPAAPPAEPVVAADAPTPPPAKEAAPPPPADAPPPKADAAPPAKEQAPPTEPKPDGPLFTLPEDFKAPEAMLAKFEEFAKSNQSVAQTVADLYVGFARDANVAWQKQIQDLDKANADQCKALFTDEELKAAEDAVGFFSSHNPGFKNFAKRQLNDPHFTLLMRYIGEQLQEDSVGSVELPTQPVDKRPLRERAADKLYGKGAKAS